MRICIAQTRPIKGEVLQNLSVHIEFIKKAINEKADVIIFPELSLTGYEPTLSRQLATTIHDSRLDVLQKMSDDNAITIGVGLPTVENSNIFISMAIFQPNKERLLYSKQYLHPTEIDIFTAGHNPIVLNIDNENIVAPAICYELSNDEHSRNAHQKNATVYIASVLNSVTGVDNDIRRLSEIAAKYSMTTFMANFVGMSGGYECAGKSSIWNDKGDLVAQLDGTAEGLLIYDTKTKEVVIM